MSRHNTHLAPLTNNPRAITSNHARLALALQGIHDADLIPLGNTLSDGNDELDFLLDSLNDGVGGPGGRDVDD